MTTWQALLLASGMFAIAMDITALNTTRKVEGRLNIESGLCLFFLVLAVVFAVVDR